jgi:hypothetical protein
VNADEAARGRALVERICDLSRIDPALTDSDFSHAVRRVGRAMAAGGEDYLAAGADLAQYLLSDVPLGPGERRELALLVLGAHRPAPHRHRTAHAGNPRVTEVVEAYRAAIAAGALPKNATAEICKRFGISLKTLRNYRRLVEEYEKALARNKSL